jgi:hypothetical protein
MKLYTGYSVYHGRCHDFVTRELLSEDELPDYHRLLASWLQRPEDLTLDYRWMSLAHHLFVSGDREGLRR